MEIKQALDILSQTINLALANGTFKQIEDVEVVGHAKKIVVDFIAERLQTKSEGPTKSK